MTDTASSAIARFQATGVRLLDRAVDVPGFAKVAVRAALAGGSLASGSLFWVRAALGQNQLAMHECRRDGWIGIGGVSEQFFSEGFLGAWHEVLARELGDRAPDALYEVGKRGARWEVEEAVRHAVWVPPLLRRFVGKPELLGMVRESPFFHALLRETLFILYRMIMKEGGWGVVEEIDFLGQPARVTVANSPESRQLGATGRPSCHVARGIYTGYLSTIFGVPAQGVETACRCQGDARCTFAITLG